MPTLMQMVSHPGADDPLEKHIAWYVGQGYHVVSQTETSAQLVKPKRLSIVWALIWLIVGMGLGLILYLLYYVSKRDKQVYLTVTEGRVSAA